jgi:hypothetical protein
MEEIIIRYTFELEDGRTRSVIIKDIREDILDSDIISFANKLISKNAGFNGSKFTAIKKKEKIMTKTEIIEKKKKSYREAETLR